MISPPPEYKPQPPFKKGDQVTWNESVLSDTYLKKYRKMWGDGPFTVVSVVRERQGFINFSIKVKKGRWYLYSQMPRDCHKEIPIGHLRTWQIACEFKKINSGKSTR